MRFAGHVVLFCLLWLVCGIAPVWADAPSPTVLIIDSSGSMAAKLPDGRTRLDAARAVIASTLLSWPEGGNVAVMAYGHRRKSDCADIETLVPLGPLSADAVEMSLQPLLARGKTPLSQSLVKAAALLPQGGTIVLVSDGLETCAGNPCDVAAALRAANGGISIQVIGFGLQQDEVAQLQCIAGNAGGEFFDAKNADGLLEALKAVSVTVAEPEPVPRPAAEIPPKIVRTELIAVAGALGEIIGTPVKWRVTNASGESIYDGESRAVGIDLFPGAYTVAVSASNARFAKEITVAAQQGQSFKIDVNAGRLDLVLKPHKGAPVFSDQEAIGILWSLQSLKEQAPASVPAIAQPSLLLAPGPYLVRVTVGTLAAEAEVNIVAGAVSNAELELRLGTLVLEAILEGDDQPLRDASLISWRIGAGETEESIAGQARPKLVLQEGTYPVTLSVAGFEIASSASVKAGEESLARVVVRGGTLLLSAKLGPQSPPLEDWRDTFWTITPVATLAGASPVEMLQASPAIPLAAGSWRIALKSGAAMIERDVIIRPDSDTALALNLDSGRLTLRGHPGAGEAPANIVFAAAEVAETGIVSANPAFEAGTSDEVSTILPAGRWLISASDSDGRHGEMLVDLAPGEEKVVDIVLK